MIKKEEAFVVIVAVILLVCFTFTIQREDGRDGLSVELKEGVEYSVLAIIDAEDLAVLRSPSAIEPRLYRAPMLDDESPSRFVLRDGKAIPADPPPL